MINRVLMKPRYDNGVLCAATVCEASSCDAKETYVKAFDAESEGPTYGVTRTLHLGCRSSSNHPI